MAQTDMKMVGPAADVAATDQVLNQLQGFGNQRNAQNADRSILIENHKMDFIGSLIGGNPYTVTTNTRDKDRWTTIKDIFGDDTSPHNCYGLGNRRCITDGYRTGNIPESQSTSGYRNRPYNNSEKMYPTYPIHQLIQEVKPQGEK